MTEGSGRKIEMTREGKTSIVEGSKGRGLGINVPINLKRRSGRQLITLPDGSVCVRFAPRGYQSHIVATGFGTRLRLASNDRIRRRRVVTRNCR